jgi:hypothetical protein
MEAPPARKPATVLDFVHTNPDKLDVCSGTAAGAGGFDEIVRAIGTAIGDNVTCLSIATGVIVACLAVVWYAAVAMYKAVSEWRDHQLQGKPDPDKRQQQQQPGEDHRDDDVEYALAPGSDGIPPDLGPAPTAPIVAARMAKLAHRYSSYNEAMRQRAVEKGMVADDIMDASILSRANDDWNYPKRHGRGGGSGAIGGRPWALRSPVYNMNGP